MMKLTVEDAMFVEESYSSGQAVVKMPTQSTSTISQLKSVIALAQSKTRQVPNWL